MSRPGSRAAEADAGLNAVARVRGVRETDSRIGLQRAMSEQRAAEAVVAALRARIAAAGNFEVGTPGSFLVLRESLQALGEALLVAEESRNGTRTITEAALSRWQADRAKLAAIEMLLEHRAAERRAEAAKAEARELDDIAAQRWLRQNSTQEAGAA